MDVKKLNLDSTKSAIVGIDLGTTNSAVAIYSAQTVPTLLPIVNTQCSHVFSGMVEILLQ